PQTLVISCTVSAVSGHLLYCVRSLWSFPVRCPQTLVIPCKNHMYTTKKMAAATLPVWRACVLTSLSNAFRHFRTSSEGIPCTVSAVSGHLLYCVRSLWSFPVLCPQSLVIPCTMSAVSGHPLYYVRS
ncbi:unnamed protein product, partial [Staurois parvus]